jgi:hypothetical protein
MHLPEDVHHRLAARAVTDLDVASLLVLFTKSDGTFSEPPLNQVIRDAETPSLNAQRLRGRNRAASAGRNP